MDRAERQKLILLVLLIGLAGYVGYYGVGAIPGVQKLEAEVAKLQDERDKLDRQVKDATAMVAQLDQTKREREALELQLREISRKLPSEHESAQVLRSVETLAGKTGLHVTQVRRRPNRAQELYVEIPMEVGVVGGYPDLLKFTDQLARLPRLVTLTELRVNNRAADRPSSTAGAAAAAAELPGTVISHMVAVVFQAPPEPPAPAPKR